MSDFQVFDELPDHPKRIGKQPHPMLVEFASAMKGIPGRWVRFPGDKRWPDGVTRSKLNGLAIQIRYGNGAFKEGGFEYRIIDGVLYARWGSIQDKLEVSA